MGTVIIFGHGEGNAGSVHLTGEVRGGVDKHGAYTLAAEARFDGEGKLWNALQPRDQSRGVQQCPS